MIGRMTSPAILLELASLGVGGLLNCSGISSSKPGEFWLSLERLGPLEVDVLDDPHKLNVLVAGATTGHCRG